MSVTTGAIPTVTVRNAIGPAVRDLLEHPIPLIAVNVVWGSIALVAWMAALVSPPIAVVVSLLLVWPTAAVARVAARVVRADEVGFLDAFRWQLSRPAVAVLGLVAVLGAVVALVDIRLALALGDAAGIALATAAGWGLVALVVLACVAWPLLGDPSRASLTTRGLARLAVSVALLHTPRVLACVALVALALLVSAVLAAALLSVSVSLVALVLCRVMLPLGDTVERGAE